MLLAHAARVSPRVLRELDHWRFERPAAPVIGQIAGGRYGAAFERLGARLASVQAAAERQRRQADRELAELSQLPAARRPAVVRAARRRFRTPAFVEAALAAGWGVLLDDAVGALHWAEAAFWSSVEVKLAEGARASVQSELRLRAQALRATADHLDSPAPGLVELASISGEMQRELLSSPDLEAELAVLEAVLLRRTGRARRAFEALRRALEILDEVAQEDRPWLPVAHRELEALAGGPATTPQRPSIVSARM